MNEYEFEQIMNELFIANLVSFIFLYVVPIISIIALLIATLFKLGRLKRQIEELKASSPIPVQSVKQNNTNPRNNDSSTPPPIYVGSPVTIDQLKKGDKTTLILDGNDIGIWRYYGIFERKHSFMPEKGSCTIPDSQFIIDNSYVGKYLAFTEEELSDLANNGNVRKIE